MRDLAAHLLVISERDALAWVLAHQRMAFPRRRLFEAAQAAPGDSFLLYTTRGCFHNARRDRGRVIGEATVASAVEPLAEPVEIAGRTFTLGCDLKPCSLASLHRGVELAPLVPHLGAFPDPTMWSVRLRRTVMPLPPADARLLRDRLRPLAGDPADHLDDYLAAGDALAAGR